MAKRAPLVLTAAVVFILIAGAVAVYAYDSGRKDLIANGVRVAGVDVGGLRQQQATNLLRQRLAERLARPVVVKAGGHRFHLSAKRAGVTADIDGMVAKAVADSRSGNVVSRSWRGLTGKKLNESIPLRLSYNDRAVRSLVRHIARRINRAAKDASVTPTASGLQTVQSHVGYALQSRYLRARVEHALSTPGASRRILAHTKIVQPQVSTADLAGRYPWYIVVNRPAFRLTVYKDLKPLKTFTVAVGRQGLETPAGLYHVQDKQVNPSWHVPNSSWAGALAGKVIPPGPDDPIKARWLGIFNGAGIHGTDELSSLGSAASHGCIRMAIPDVIQVYNWVPVGAPVFIA
jgi:lipoprotein-anchoring transpeptidase ErfK/SrfK